MAVETNNPEHLGALRRRGLQANEDRRRGLPRCPVCFIIRDAMPKEFTCRLSRCPRVFVNIQPPAGSLPTADKRA